MTLEIKTTDDGTTTLYNSELNENYHSTFGALQESLHVYINAGFYKLTEKQCRILEIGFGTGLNALLTAEAAMETQKKICYHSIEKFPLPKPLSSQLDFGEKYRETLQKIHQTAWNKTAIFHPYFTLKKIHADVIFYNFSKKYDLIYYDAFAPDKQPQLWTNEVLQKITDTLTPNGIFVTYSTKGTVKQALRALGLEIKRLPGAPGKRDMLFARKTIM